MNGNHLKRMIAGMAAFAVLGVAAPASAQRYGRYDADGSAVVECAAGQRAVMEQRRIDGRMRVVARCERPSVQRSYAQVQRAPQRSKTKTALMIAGGAATGAGVGGALKGKKGALIGAAIGGGGASIYESVKRR